MHKLTEAFKNDINRYNDFCLKSEALIKELLIQSSINYHKIESRVKDPNKLENKIIRKDAKYEQLNDITDLIGIRIITYFEDEVDKIAEIIENEFDLDKNNSIDKRMSESDRFGYKSLHYVVTINSSRKLLTEYARFKSLKIEIQIRSILQHAWAEIEHDIGYKGEISIPDSLKRNFYRVAALLETADIEFVNIRNKLKDYENELPKNIQINPENVDLNFASLNSFIATNNLVKELDTRISAENGLILKDGITDINGLLEKLHFLNIKNVKELEVILFENSPMIPPFAKIWFGFSRKASNSSVGYGICIFYLCYVIVGRSNNPDFANKYMDDFVMKGHTSSTGKNGDDILEVYKKINE